MDRWKLEFAWAGAKLFGVPTDAESWICHYLLSGDDIDLIRTRRRAENHLGVAVHSGLLSVVLRSPPDGALEVFAENGLRGGDGRKGTLE